MAKRFCICGALTSGYRCPKCTQSSEKTASSTKAGYGYDWQQCRESYLQKSPVCEDCESRGIVAPAAEVHHIVPIGQAWHLRLDHGNLSALCKACHDARHGKGENGRTANGTLAEST